MLLHPYFHCLHCLSCIISRYIDLEEYDNAKAELEKAVKAHPDHISCLHNMASVYEYLKQPEKAKEYLDKVLAIDPQNANAIAYKNLLEGATASGEAVAKGDAASAEPGAADSASGSEESPELDSLLD